MPVTFLSYESSEFQADYLGEEHFVFSYLESIKIYIDLLKKTIPGIQHLIQIILILNVNL